MLSKFKFFLRLEQIGGDWFLAWQNTNLALFQQGSLSYVLEIFVAFVYLKLIRQ